MRARNTANQKTGAAFESAFAFMCGVEGLMAVRNGQLVRWLPGGKTLAVKSNLDWTVLGPGAQACFLDTKSFAGKAFAYSALDPRQLQLSLAYAERGFHAGFVVCFRETMAIAYFAGTRVAALGARRSFAASDGLALGTFQRFSVAAIFRTETKARALSGSLS